MKQIAYRETKKFNFWASLYTNSQNKETFGNATKSAIIAYNYDPKNQYHLASVVGSKNMRKYEILASIEADKQGYGFARLIQVGIGKMIEGSFKDWESFMTRLDYFNKNH